jgi:hypothetical protein
MMEPQAQEEHGNSRQIESDYAKVVLYPIYLPIIDKLEIWGTNEQFHALVIADWPVIFLLE